ncbi:MAG: hypothetical protein MIO92_12855 [Methanosarcinaceae archaeon]|nr:hypothetical protein [Methanosarcinaceae archaeon]
MKTHEPKLDRSFDKMRPVPGTNSTWRRPLPQRSDGEGNPTLWLCDKFPQFFVVWRTPRFEETAYAVAASRAKSKFSGWKGKQGKLIVIFTVMFLKNVCLEIRAGFEARKSAASALA